MYVEIDGLSEGEKVILNPTGQIQDGVKVRDMSQNQVKK